MGPLSVCCLGAGMRKVEVNQEHRGVQKGALGGVLGAQQCNLQRKHFRNESKGWPQWGAKRAEKGVTTGGSAPWQGTRGKSWAGHQAPGQRAQGQEPSCLRRSQLPTGLLVA